MKIKKEQSHAHSSGAKRSWFALLSVLLAPGLMLGAHLAETYYRHWVYAAAPLLSLGLLALWWSVVMETPWKTKRRRVMMVAGLTTLLSAFLACLLRLDGSHQGSSLPRMAWRWSARSGEFSIPSSAPVYNKGSSAEASSDTAEVLPQAADALTFLGPDRDGRIPRVKLDSDWEAHPPELLWRQQIGLGWGAFAVSGSRAVTLEQREEDEWVSCYHLATGELLWHHAWPGERFSESMGGDGPRSTPSIAGDRVFTLGGTGILAGFRLTDGKLLWQRNILEDAAAPNLTWATTASPLLANGLVIVPGGEKSGPELLAYHQDSGTEVWKSGSMGGSYASPRLVSLNGRQAILNVHGSGVAAHDPATGSKLWNYPWGNKFPKVAQPHVLQGDKVLVTASYNQGSHLIRIAPNADGLLHPSQIWESSRMKTKFSSASIIGEHIYGLDEGTFACVEVATGDRVWKDGRYGFGQHLEVGRHILLLTERGSLVLIDPSPESHLELASLKVLDGKCWAAPTLAGTYCLLRSETEITCLRLPGRVLPPEALPLTDTGG